MAAAVASGHDFGSGMPPSASGEEPDFQQLVLGCNKDGMDFLRRSQYKQAFEQLKYAEAVLVAKQGEDEPTNLLAVTCNNLGCYYKKVGKLHAALSYLRKALKIEVTLQTDDVTIAGTHLNICAILSKLDKHDKAVQHALCALELISNRVASASESVSQDEYSVLAIAYHNVAVERDYMRQWQQAAAAYEQGHQVAKKCLGEQHPLTQTLGKNCEAAVQKAQKPGRERSPPREPVAAPLSSRRPPKAPGAEPAVNDGGAQGGSLLPQIGGSSSSRHENLTMSHQQAEEAMPIPAVRHESQQSLSADWMQSEEAAWRNQQASLPPLQQSPSLGQFQQTSSAAMMAPQEMSMQGQRGVGAASYPPPLMQESHPSGPFAAPTMEAVEPVAQPPPFQFDRDLASAVNPTGPPASPPPLVIVGREPKRQAKEVREDRDGPPPPLFESQPRVRLPPGAGRRERGAALAEGPKPPAGARPARTRPNTRSGGDQASGAAGGKEVGSLRPPQQQLLRRTAAEKIQRAWRASHQKHRQHIDVQARQQSAATRIQARFREYRVRRARLNKAATAMQRHARGFVVRLREERRKAILVIQRHATGMLVRRMLAEEEKAAIAIQKRLRGAQAREEAKLHQHRVLRATMRLQRVARCWKARRVVQQKRDDRDFQNAQKDAASKIQSVFRGNKDREVFSQKYAQQEDVLRRRRAATKIQSHVRRHQATKRVEIMRQVRLQTMSQAATVIRKFWLRYLLRRRFKQLRKEFLIHEDSVITMQRYVRGYVVRLRMWRDAIRAEEELWAAVEIQRCWRGYQGRLRWELEYESVWSRVVAAQRIQRFVRGWLGRTRVHRLRKKLARAEFEKARRRFKASQKIQAITRGLIVRKRIRAFRERKTQAVTTIQRIHRGHNLRVQLHHKAKNRRTVQIQSLARGFLVRNRRFHLIAKVILIQAHYRQWLERHSQAERQQRVEKWRLQRAAAKGQ
mmetsp:Transcript_68983/g.177796  ORF Transcript_68983/g.177796 Transcript_68983/m.177796 type:complete len:969 (-) Transcript_68983:236-3142(-)|eukprot:CAMPEP_0195064252 /NCGR_PEP_ID=MMETSP0448-20130528/10377_1 /TAXON_ID=66468 /ORGANISM="Heterocapsa triquestra, Strain CCMP 448" /LENGTH=968 /DNA_ID=CAMNT_0040095251 /DNA_START=44 /DNA_END=2950 /DNA_ORIENTATION=-